MGARSLAAAQTGHATIIDSDTLKVAGMRVRLSDIDAPESRQTCLRVEVAYRCGQLATQHLRTLIAGWAITCAPRARDRYERTVTLCRLLDLDLSASMVRDGYAPPLFPLLNRQAASNAVFATAGLRRAGCLAK